MPFESLRQALRELVLVAGTNPKGSPTRISGSVLASRLSNWFIWNAFSPSTEVPLQFDGRK
jgi:hypothetical protein